MPSDFSGELARRGFVLECERPHSQLHFVRWRNESVRNEVTLAPLDGKLACRLYCRYHSVERDSWGDEGPVFLDVFSHELTKAGLVEIGTPGSACWDQRPSDAFFSAFDKVAISEFDKCATLPQLRDFAIRKIGGSPKDRSARLLAALIELDLGNRPAAGELFEAYLKTLPPRLEAVLRPKIQATLS